MKKSENVYPVVIGFEPCHIDLIQILTQPMDLAAGKDVFCSRVRATLIVSGLVVLIGTNIGQ